MLTVGAPAGSTILRGAENIRSLRWLVTGSVPVPTSLFSPHEVNSLPKHSRPHDAPPRHMGPSSRGLDSNTGNQIYHFFSLFLSSNMVTVTFKNVAQKRLDRQAVVVWMRNVSYSLGHLDSWGSGGTHSLAGKNMSLGPALRAQGLSSLPVYSPSLVLVAQDVSPQLLFQPLPGAGPPAMMVTLLPLWNCKPE